MHGVANMLSTNASKPASAADISRLSRSFLSLRGDRRGSVSVIFGLIGLTLMLFIGAAVDMGRWLHAHSKTKEAVDAAVLAGARTLQVTGGNATEAETTANSFYQSNVDSRPSVIDDSIAFKVGDDGKSVRASGTAYIKTPFLSLVDIDRLPLWKDTGADQSEASIALGSADGKIEISMMLDTTGSMAGQKIADLKVAAKGLVDIMLPDNGATGDVRIAVAPFAETVRPGSNFLTKVRGSKKSSISVKDSSGRLQTYKLTECVSERSGAAAYTDAVPSGSFDLVSPVYSKSGSCTPASSILTLTSDKTQVKSVIDGLSASGGTAGHLGSAWAWYLLSPKWASIWPTSSAPAAYGEAHVKKIAILMTDGEYNTQYDSSGVMTSTSGLASVNGPSDVQARTVCQNMKASGITVYTVGFNLVEPNAISTLQQCATEPGMAYLAQNGSQLQNAFRDIAVKLTPLHLTN